MDLFVRRGLSLVSIVGLFYILGLLIAQLFPILMPFLAAIVIAYLFNPLVELLTRWVHIPRWLAIALVFLTITITAVVVLWFLVPLVWEQVLYARANIPNAIQWLNFTLRPWIQHTFHIETSRINLNVVTTWMTNYLQTHYSFDDTQQMLTRIAQSGMSIISVLSLIVLVPIVTFYLLLDWKAMLERLHRLIPRRIEPRTVQILHECDQVLGSFVKGQLLVMILLGIVYAVGLQLIGISVGLIIGIVAGLLSIIPYMGFAVGIFSAAIACLFQYGFAWQNLALVGIVFMVGQVIEGYILQPFLLGDRIGLSPVAVIFAVLAGAQLGGVIGMLIALPVAALLVVLMRHLHEFYETTEFYSASYPITLADSFTEPSTVRYDLPTETNDAPNLNSDQQSPQNTTVNLTKTTASSQTDDPTTRQSTSSPRKD
ncbi:AI-2E family transporter [Aquirhabdus sp.]|uniref:AI-2E family transporter n=1 Tax=Aquirhabdus sp. TaxID=2824160 RepID=UPI00396C913F